MIAPLRILVVILLVLCGAACSSGSSSGSGKDAAAPVRLALDWLPEPEFGGFYAARESGAFRNSGFPEVEILAGGTGVPVVQMVAAGKADFGVVGAGEVLIARSRGADILPLYATFQTSPQGIMVHAARGFTSLADLFKTGGSLAVETGSPAEAFLKKKFGFDKVKVVSYDGGVARFVADKELSQQCYITSEPIAARKKGSDPAVFLLAEAGLNPYVAVLIVRRALWSEKPDRVKAFARAARDGWKAYLADPKPTNAVMGKLNTAMDAATFAEASEAQKPLIETEQTKKAGLGSMTRERWEELGKQLLELGVIDKVNLPELVSID
jgi:NitT/TauT family transport system substrate-binding protein